MWTEQNTKLNHDSCTWPTTSENKVTCSSELWCWLSSPCELNKIQKPNHDPCTWPTASSGIKVTISSSDK